MSARSCRILSGGARARRSHRIEELAEAVALDLDAQGNQAAFLALVLRHGRAIEMLEAEFDERVVFREELREVEFPAAVVA